MEGFEDRVKKGWDTCYSSYYGTQCVVFYIKKIYNSSILYLNELVSGQIMVFVVCN